MMARVVPVRRDQLRHHLTAFRKWLVDNGAEVGSPTNPYEVLRYRAYWRNTRTAATHVIYAKESGLLTWCGGSLGHFRAFIGGELIDGGEERAKPVPDATPSIPTPSKTEKRRSALLLRDGSDCWFCGEALGTDITIEHLVPRSKGGVNHLDNYALAHSRCNLAAADMPLTAKIEMRNKLRARIGAPVMEPQP